MSTGRLRVDLDDAPGRHRAEPLADVPLVELGRVGELLARRLLELREGVEKARAVADGGHDHERAAVQQSSIRPRMLRRARCRTQSRTSAPPRARTLVFHLVLTCARCGQENPDGAKFCNACGAALVGAGRAGRGAAARLRAVRRSRGLHLSLREARPRGRPGVPRAVLRARAQRAREPRRQGREVRRRRGDGRVRRPGDVRRRCRAGRTCRLRRPRLGRARGAPAARRGQHGRGDRRPRRQPRARGDLRRGGRREHRGPSAVRIAGRGGARRRGDVHRDPRIHRVPAGPAGRWRRGRRRRCRRGSPSGPPPRSGSGRRRPFR